MLPLHIPYYALNDCGPESRGLSRSNGLHRFLLPNSVSSRLSVGLPAQLSSPQRCQAVKWRSRDPGLFTYRADTVIDSGHFKHALLWSIKIFFLFFFLSRKPICFLLLPKELSSRNSGGESRRPPREEAAEFCGGENKLNSRRNPPAQGILVSAASQLCPDVAACNLKADVIWPEYNSWIPLGS